MASSASIRLFDTHAHLDSEPFQDDLDGVIQRAIQAGVVGICVVGCTPDSTRQCLRIAEQYPHIVCAAAGIQPNYVSQATESWMSEIEQLAESPLVVAIGETGLDCYWDDSPLALQRQFFQAHLELSSRLDKPLVIHMRDSGEELLEMLTEQAKRLPIRGIMHSFTGGWELAKSFLDLGLHISFAGMVTFKNGTDLRHVAMRVPADRLLIETDSPYLSPEPLRGKRPNEPARVVHTASVVAEVRGLSVEELGDLTANNAQELFRWPN